MQMTPEQSQDLKIGTRVGFNGVRSDEPGIWIWSLSANESKEKTGKTKTKPDAVIAAWRAIDQELVRKSRAAAIAR
jgi:hypothetical protein